MARGENERSVLLVNVEWTIVQLFKYFQTSWGIDSTVAIAAKTRKKLPVRLDVSKLHSKASLSSKINNFTEL